MPQTCFIWPDDELQQPRHPATDRPALRLIERPQETATDLPPALIEELGRILGEVLVQQYRDDSESIVKPRSGFTYPPVEDETHG